MHVVGQSVEQSTGQTLGAEHACPLVEWQIAGDNRRASLIAVNAGVILRRLAGGKMHHS